MTESDEASTTPALPPEAEPPDLGVMKLEPGLETDSIRGSGAPIDPGVITFVEGLEGNREIASETERSD